MNAVAYFECNAPLYTELQNAYSIFFLANLF